MFVPGRRNPFERAACALDFRAEGHDAGVGTANFGYEDEDLVYELEEFNL
jgi:hypothetical protein